MSDRKLDPTIRADLKLAHMTSDYLTRPLRSPREAARDRLRKGHAVYTLIGYAEDTGETYLYETVSDITRSLIVWSVANGHFPDLLAVWCTEYNRQWDVSESIAEAVLDRLIVAGTADDDLPDFIVENVPDASTRIAEAQAEMAADDAHIRSEKYAGAL